MPPIEAPSKEALNFFNEIDEPGAKAPVIEEVDPNKKEDEEKLKQQQKTKEDEPEFKREPRKQKATSDESIATLRKQRDEEREKNKKFTETFGDHPPEVIKPLLDIIIERAEGPITPDLVTKILQEFKESGSSVENLRKELQEKEKKVTELDIRFSDEFKNNFEKPYKDAMASLFLEFANVDSSKKVIAPKATAEFNEFLTSTPDLDGVTVKSALTKFARDYKAESGGEDPLLPSITDLMKSIRELNNKKVELHQAYDNWAVKKKETQEKALIENEAQSEQQKKALKKQRIELASKAYREFDLDEFPFIEDKEAEELFREEFNFGESIREGKDVPEYDKLLQRGVKSRLWDKYSKELVELREFKEKIEKGERNDLRGSDRIDVKKKTGDGKYSQDHYLD